MLIRVAYRNALVHWKQSLAALLSISMAFVSFVIFQGYMLNVRWQYLDGYRNRSMYGSFLIQNSKAFSKEAKSSPDLFRISLMDQNQIKKLLSSHQNDIQIDVPFLIFSGLISTGRQSKIFWGQSFDIQKGAVARDNWSWNALYGVPLHISKESAPILLGQTLAEQLGCVPQKKISSLLLNGGYVPEKREFTCLRPDVQLSLTTVNGNLNALDFTVTGLVDAGYKDVDSRYLTVPLDLAQKLLDTDKISFWTVKLKDNLNEKKWIKNFDQEIKNINPELQAVSWIDHEFGEIYIKTMSLLNVFRNFVTIVVAFISILSVMNTMVKVVKERTREIGTLLSIGFERSQVLKLFLYESFFLSVMGCLVGAVIGLVSSLIINHAGISYRAGILSEPVPFLISIDLFLYIFAFLMLTFVTVVASYLACRGTINKKIVDCLAYA